MMTKQQKIMLNTDYKFGEVHGLADQIEPEADKVHFKNIFNNGNGGVAIVAFKAGQQLDTHIAPAELMVNVLEGEIEFTVLSKANTIKAGQFMLVGAGVPHSVAAKSDSKMLLVKLRP